MALHGKNKQPIITDKRLHDINTAMREFHESFRGTIALVMPSKGCTIKYHKLSHVTEVIKRLGNLKEYDA
jgi:hypothetical protein